MSSNSTNPWEPHFQRTLNFSSCPAAGEFIANLFMVPNLGSMDIDVVLRFLGSLDPSYGTHKGPGYWKLLQWWDSLLSSENPDYIYNLIVGDTLVFVQDQCPRQTVCNYVRQEGDPDLAGIGMMVSYYLIATLASLYVIIISLNAVKALRDYQPWTRFHAIFENTLNSFLDISLLFSISMLLAAIYRLSSAFQHPDRDENTFLYSQLNAVTVSMFSVLPPLMLQFPERRLRRKGIRAMLWFLVIAFVTTLTILFHQWRGHDSISKHFVDHMDDMLSKHADQALWLALCDMNNISLLDALDCAIIITQVILFLNLPRWICLLFTILSAQRKSPRIPQRHVDNGLCRILSEWQKTYGWVRALNIVVCWGTMWLLLSIFTAITVHLADAMGQWGKDRRWSVGQVLAMATFAPLIIDIIAIALGNPVNALEGKMPWSLRVVQRGQSVDLTESKDSRHRPSQSTGNSSEYDLIGDERRIQTV